MPKYRVTLRHTSVAIVEADNPYQAAVVASARHGDDVEIANVHPDKYRQALLTRPHRPNTAQLIMLAKERHRLAIKESPQDLDRLGHTCLADRRWIERHSNRVVLGERVTSPYAKFDASIGQVIDRRDLAGKVHRMMKVAVDDQGHSRTRSVTDCEQR